MHERAGQQQAPAHAAGQHRGAHVGLRAQVEDVHHLARAAARPGALHAVVAAVVEQRLLDVEEAVEVDVLLGQPDQRPGGVGAVVVAEDARLAGGDADEVADRADERRLARPVGPQQTEEGAVGHHEVEAVEGEEAIVVALRETFEREGSRRGHPHVDVSVPVYPRGMRIGELARRAGVTTRTVRYYKPPSRGASGGGPPGGPPAPPARPPRPRPPSPGPHRLRPRPRLHGHVRVLRRPRRRRVDRHHPPRPRPRRQLPRHRRHVRPVHQRGARRARHRRPPRPGRAGHEVRHHPRPRRPHRTGHQRQSRVRPAGLRRLAEAPRRRPHRPLLPAPRRPRDADRGDRRRDGRARAGGQGPLPRPVRGRPGHPRRAPRRAPDHRPADRVLAVDARSRRTRSCPRAASWASASSPTARWAAASSPARSSRSTTSTRTTTGASRPASRARTSSATWTW